MDTNEEKVINCQEDIPILLSWKTCMKLGMIYKKFPKPIYSLKQEFDVETEKRLLLEEFADVHSNNQELKPMKGGPMKIYLEENAQPNYAKVARQIPFMLQKEVKQKLDDLCSKNNIRPLEDEPTEWRHPMVVVSKLKEVIRLCGDFTKMSKFVKRPMHSVKTHKEAVAAINPRAKFFSTFVASKGYWQIAFRSIK